MAASHLIYSVPVLVDNLNKITDNVALTTHDNITNPTPVYVQTILFELLKEIGFTRWNKITNRYLRSTIGAQVISP
jgi:hypothetical protein